MLLRRFLILATLLLSFGSSVALTEPSSLTSQTVAQNNESVKPPNLTREQARQIGEAHDLYKDKIAQRNQELRQAQQELDSLMSGSASESEVREKYRQVAALRQLLDDLRFDSMMAVRSLLTPEQHRQLTEYLQQQREKYRNRTSNRRDSGR